MSTPPPFSLPCPPTPVMLYIGAGYDLSPLLTFAPGGPPYPIVPLSDQDHAHADLSLFLSPDKYTSFLFVDAKPRVTSAYMVSDFHEWTSLEARVRNVLHYAQGSLTRWRTVPGAPDLLWFEGGGDLALVESRRGEPAWVFHDPVLPDSFVTTSAIPYDSAGEPSSPKPLTTLLYLFNTLDVELVHAPLLEHVWPRVEALYVHGLRLHVRTGAGMGLGRHTAPKVMVSSRTDTRDSSAGVHRCTVADLHGASLQTQLGTGLKRCFVIVGSWGTPLHKPRSRKYKSSRSQEEGGAEGTTVHMGVRHVDFVSEAWRRWQEEARTCSRPCPPLSTSLSLTSSSPPLPSTPFSVSPTRLSAASSTSLRSQTNVPPASPIIFRRPCIRHSVSLYRDCHPEGGWDSDYSGDSEDVCMDWDESEYEHLHEQGDGGDNGIVESALSSPPRLSGPFHVRIPQLAWSSTLRGGRGGYFVEKTVEKSLSAWRGRQGSYPGESEEDESASEGEFNYDEDEKRDEMVQEKKTVNSLYGLRSFFSIRAHTSPASPTLAHPVTRTSIIPRSRKPPPRSRLRLRPRPPTPAHDSEGTESENSASETVFGLGHYEGDDRTGGVWGCGCQRRKERSAVGYEMGMKSEKESVAFGFWRRSALPARRKKEDLNGRVRLCDPRRTTGTRARAMSMSPARTTTNVVSHQSRKLYTKSLDATPSYTSNPQPPSAISQHCLKSRERRIDIVDFLSTTSDPNACNVVGSLSPSDALIPTSVSDPVGPIMFSVDTARDSSAPDSAPSAISSFFPTPASSTLWPFSSPSLSPASLAQPTTFPPSPYGPSELFDSNNVEKKPSVRSSKESPLLMQLPFWRRNMTKQQHRREYETSTYISRAGSISGLLWWKPPMAPLARPSPSGLPLSPTSVHTNNKSIRHHHPHKDVACVVHRHSHTRARTTTHRQFRFDPDAPPVPPLPPHFRGHNHTRSLGDPTMHRGDSNWAYDSCVTCTRTRASSSNALPTHILPSTAPARQNAESDTTHNGS